MGPGGLPPPPGGIGAPGAKVARRFWLRILTGLFGVIYQAINLYTTGRDFDEPTTTFRIPGLTKGNPDKDTWWRIYWGKDEAGRNEYFYVGKQLPENIRTLTNTLGQFFSKLSFPIRIALEQALGVRPQGGILDPLIPGRQLGSFPVEPGPTYRAFEAPGSRQRHLLEQLRPWMTRPDKSVLRVFPKTKGISKGRAYFAFQENWRGYAKTGDKQKQIEADIKIKTAMASNNLDNPVKPSKTASPIPRSAFLQEEARQAVIRILAKDLLKQFAREGPGAVRDQADQLGRLGWTQANFLASNPGLAAFAVLKQRGANIDKVAGDLTDAKIQWGTLSTYTGDITLYGKKVQPADVVKLLRMLPPPPKPPSIPNLVPSWRQLEEATVK